MNVLKIADDISKCNDVNEISDIVLLAAMRMHELVASDAMKRAEIVLHGTHIETGIKHTVRITRDN